jgi:hypothetical protein
MRIGTLSYDEQMNARELRQAEAVREACLAAAIEAAERAGVAGVCAEGRLDAALDAIRAVRVERIRLPPEEGDTAGGSTSGS